MKEISIKEVQFSLQKTIIWILKVEKVDKNGLWLAKNLKMKILCQDFVCVQGGSIKKNLEV